MSIKNFKLYESAKEFFKKNKIRLATGFLAIVMGISGFLITRKYKDYMDQKNQTSIVQHYGKESQATKILEYLKMSKKLHDLDLDDYKINENLFYQYNISNGLKSIEDINDLIKKYEQIKDRDENLVAQNEDITVILNLISQEKAVNKYLFSQGYSVANDAVKNALQEYANMHYGLNANTTEFSASVTGGDESVLVTDGNNNVKFDNFFPNHVEKVIMDGIRHLDNTDYFKDPNSNDNNDYNKKRNEYIMDALLFAIEVNEELSELENSKHR